MYTQEDEYCLYLHLYLHITTVFCMNMIKSYEVNVQDWKHFGGSVIHAYILNI